MTPPKLSVDSSGRVIGSNVTWNSPWPCSNGDNGGMSVPHGIVGVVEHTMVGNLLGTIELFNDSSYQASAHFGIDQSGNIHQFGPITGWKAWAQEAGNESWYSIEHADDGNPGNPLTSAQMNASAQLVELLSRIGVFPLQVTNSTGTEGYGVHYMGGAAWGGHSCPQEEDGEGPRANQRYEIIDIAKAIRSGAPAPKVSAWECMGQKSLHDLAAQLANEASTILRLTAEHSPGAVYTTNMANYINGVLASDTVKVPEGVELWLGNEWFISTGHQTLQGIALGRGLHPAGIIQSTAEHSPSAIFAGDMASYLNGVFSRSSTHIPKGIHVYYYSG